MSMRSDVRLLAAATSPLVAGGCLAIALLRGASTPLPPELAAARATRTTELRDVVVTGRAEGRTAWEIRAPKVSTGSRRGDIDFTGGITAVLHRNGAPKVRSRAASGRFTAGSGLLRLAGPVVATILPATTPTDDDVPRAAGTIAMRTDALQWNTKQRGLDAPGRVDVEFDRGSAQVDALHLDMDARSLETKGFRGRFLIRESEL